VTVVPGSTRTVFIPNSLLTFEIVSVLQSLAVLLKFGIMLHGVMLAGRGVSDDIVTSGIVLAFVGACRYVACVCVCVFVCG